MSHKVYAGGLLILTLVMGGCSATRPAMTVENAVPAPLARLGAGDELGQAIFNHYVAMVRAGQQETLPLPRTAEGTGFSDDPWLIMIRLPQGVVGVGGRGDSTEAVSAPAPASEPPNQEVQAI